MRAMNLLPVEERGGARPVGAPSRLTAVHGIAGAGALVTVGLLASFAMAKQETSTAREATAAAITRSATAQAQVDRLAPVVAFDARRQARESAVLQLASGRTDWASVLQATAGSLPSSVTLTTVKLADASGAAATTTGTTTGAAPSGLGGSGTVALSICADSQPRVASTLRRLRALPQVEDVALSQTGVSGADGASTTDTECKGVAADAALGLSATSALDASPTAESTASGAATPAPATTGASR